MPSQFMPLEGLERQPALVFQAPKVVIRRGCEALFVDVADERVGVSLLAAGVRAVALVRALLRVQVELLLAAERTFVRPRFVRSDTRERGPEQLIQRQEVRLIRGSRACGFREGEGHDCIPAGTRLRR